MKARTTRQTLVVASIALMFVGTGMIATAYHISDEVAPHCTAGSHPAQGTNPGGMGVGPTDCDNPATQWTVGNILLVICESEGPNDPQNPQANKTRGVGGLCYASSDHADVKNGTDVGDKKLDPPRYNPQSLFDADETKWSRITPTCEPLNENPNPNGVFPAFNPVNCPSGLGTWFAALGVGGFGCEGTWGQSYYYTEFSAWTFGHVAGSNPDNGTGHVSFFVDDVLTSGSYKFENDITQGTLDNAFNAAKEFSPSGESFCSDFKPT